MSLEQRKIRLAAARKIMVEEGLTATLMYGTRTDSRFSTAFTGSACRSTHHYLICTLTDLYFIDIHYRADDLARASGLRVEKIAEEDQYPQYFANLLRETDRVGIAGDVPLRHTIGQKCTFFDISKKIEQLLMIKSAAEITAIASLAIDSLAVVEAEISIARSQNSSFRRSDLAKGIYGQLISQVDSFSFPLSIAVGERLRESTLGTPLSDGHDPDIATSTPVVIDFGTVRDGLFADQTRMYCSTQGSLTKAYQSMKRALHTSLKSLTPRTTIGDYCNRLEKLLAAEGLPTETLERADLGHATGFGLHEPPFIGMPEWDPYTVSEGMVLCIEPEIIVAGYRIRYEEMVAINSSGAYPLTKIC